MTTILHQLTCTRCGHKWFPRSEKKPQHCARCRSPYWDKPYVRPGYEEKARNTREADRE